MRAITLICFLGAVALLLAGCSGSHNATGSSNDSYIDSTPTPAPVAAVFGQAAPLCDAAFQNDAGGVQSGGARGPVLELLKLDESQVTASARDPDLGRWLADPDASITGVPEAQVAAAAGDAHALVCVLEQQVQVGSFAISGSPAVRIDYDVRLVSWPDGALLAGTSFTGGDPPSDRTISAACHANPDGDGCHDPVYGPSPAGDLSNWLTQQLGGQ